MDEWRSSIPEIADGLSGGASEKRAPRTTGAQLKGQVLYLPSSRDATPPAASVVAGLTEPGNPRHPTRPPTRMINGQNKGRGQLSHEFKKDVIAGCH